MITLEDKLDTFYKIVYKAEEEKAKIALEELENTQRNILEDKYNELQEKKENRIRRREGQGISEKNEMISASVDKNRKKSLVKREVLLENLIESLEIKAMNFTDTKRYEEYLTDRIKSSLNSINEDYVILGLKKKDRERIGKDIKDIENETSKDIELKDLEEDIIGGFKLWDRGKNYTLDNTFKTVIEENRYQIGKKLYIALDRAGEIDE